MDKCVIVCGAGFLGSWFCRFYGQRANALGLKNEVTVVDDGVFEDRNIPTQQMSFRHLGVHKTRVAVQAIKDYQIEAHEYRSRLTVDSVAISDFGLVVDMFDNHASRIAAMLFARRAKCECLHASISPDGFGKIEWADDWSLDPTKSLAWPEIVEVETPPCELVVFQELGVKIAMRAAAEACQHLLGLTKTSWLIADNQNTPLR